VSEKLREMLSYCRPSGSRTEEQFITAFLDEYDPLVDRSGNRILIVGEENPEVLWSSHFDTVHRKGGRQKIRVNKRGEYIATSKHSNCLGADDTAGVYIMTKLIDAKVPGVYVFHFGEEVGCIGATSLSKYDDFDILKDLKISIALDRRGKASLVTHQMGQRCASEAFGHALAKQLGMKHKNDNSGIWTDNVEYMYQIPENVNLSVGYYNQHSPQESVCPAYIAELIPALCEVDYESLPIQRDPTIIESRGWKSQHFPSSSHGTYEDLLEAVGHFPEATADALWEYGFTVSDIERFIFNGQSKRQSGEENIEEIDVGKYLAEEMEEADYWEGIHGYSPTGYAG
jgi:hypothetical protein